MLDLSSHFVEELLEPVHLIDVLSPTVQRNEESPTRSMEFKNLIDLESHLFTIPSHEYAFRFISICQRNSWRELQITKPMMELIVKEHDIDLAFWDLTSCFYKKSLDLEEVYCSPWISKVDDNCQESMYTIRYPEYKITDGKWVIRQTGCYHKHNQTLNQNLYILFNPTPNSKAQISLTEHILAKHQDIQKRPLSLHALLFRTYFPAWRQYIAFHENELLPIANSTAATFIEEPLRVGYDSLSKVFGLENKFGQIVVILSSFEEVLDGLNVQSTDSLFSSESRQHQARCKTYSRIAQHHQHRSRAVAELIAETLQLKDQIIAKNQNQNMIQLNKSAIIITIVTLIYLPPSFLASFFGMSFFALDQTSHRIIASPMTWIFAVTSVALTGATIWLYYWLLRGKTPTLSRLMPSSRVADPKKPITIKSLVRRLKFPREKPEETKEMMA